MVAGGRGQVGDSGSAEWGAGRAFGRGGVSAAAAAAAAGSGSGAHGSASGGGAPNGSSGAGAHSTPSPVDAPPADAPPAHFVPGAPSVPGGGPAWPAAGGAQDAGAPGAPVDVTPWAGTDTNADPGDDRSVPLPATVFAPPLTDVGDAGTPPPNAKTALMSGGSQLPRTATAPAVDDRHPPQGPGRPPERDSAGRTLVRVSAGSRRSAEHASSGCAVVRLPQGRVARRLRGGPGRRRSAPQGRLLAVRPLWVPQGPGGSGDAAARCAAARVARRGRLLRVRSRYGFPQGLVALRDAAARCAAGSGGSWRRRPPASRPLPPNARTSPTPPRARRSLRRVRAVRRAVRLRRARRERRVRGGESASAARCPCAGRARGGYVPTQFVSQLGPTGPGGRCRAGCGSAPIARQSRCVHPRRCPGCRMIRAAFITPRPMLSGRPVAGAELLGVLRRSPCVPSLLAPGILVRRAQGSSGRAWRQRPLHGAIPGPSGAPGAPPPPQAPGGPRHSAPRHEPPPAWRPAPPLGPARPGPARRSAPSRFRPGPARVPGAMPPGPVPPPGRPLRSAAPGVRLPQRPRGSRPSAPATRPYSVPRAGRLRAAVDPAFRARYAAPGVADAA